MPKKFQKRLGIGAINCDFFFKPTIFYLNPENGKTRAQKLT